MDIKELQKNWDNFGKTNPLWSILTLPSKMITNWQLDDFFETGIREIDAAIKYVESLGINIQRRKALDFGCGIGRLTQPLCKYFDEVCGVDIAPSMIELAKKYNRYGGKCRYYLNDTNNLQLFADKNFNFIYSNITLLHMEPRYFKNYIKEFLRILAPDGLLIFQLPSDPSKIIKRLTRMVLILVTLYYKARYGNQPRMEMHGMKQEDVTKFIEENGAKIIDIKHDQSTGKGWVSFRYCVTKE